MPDAAPASPGERAARKPDATGGTLVLVVGPSGAGKDTLIDAARAHFTGDARVAFCRRFITRRDQTSESHVPVSVDEFWRMAEAKEFFLAWEAHGLSYGIGADALAALREGRTVVANVSRRVIGEARARWPRTRVIQVTAHTDVLRERLASRGRETADGIGTRLKRAEKIPLEAAAWLTEVDNSGDLAEVVARFNALIAAAVA